MRSVVGGRTSGWKGVRVFRESAILWLVIGGSVSGFSGTTLHWNPNPETNIAGYKVFWGETNTAPTIVDVGKTNRYPVNSLQSGKSYYFYVSAYNSANLESPKSATVFYTYVANTAPSISSIPGQTIIINGVAGPVSFTVSDRETLAGNLVVSAASSNPTLIPLSRIAFGGSGSNRTVTLTPVAGILGSSSITITASDGGLAASTSFTLTVNAPPPDLSNLWLGMGFEDSGTNVLDLSPNEHDGLLTGGATRALAGDYGGVVEFNGTGGKVDLGGLDIPGGVLTIACWIRPDTFAISDARLISKASGALESDHIWMLSTMPSSGIKPRMRLKTATGITTTLLGTVNLTAGAWTHLAATYDGAAMRLYVNGQPAGSTPKTGAIVQAPTVPAAIGDQPEGRRCFDGLMDDVRIYTRALSQSQIQEAMNELLGVPQPPMDVTPPSTPQNLAASAVSSLVQLTWTASTDASGVAFYRILRDGAEIGTATSLRYSDSNVVASTTYNYRVQAVDTAGNESALSSAAVITTPSPADPDLWLAMDFDETGSAVLDSSANGNDGVLSGAVARSVASGFGGVLDFAGTGGRVDLGGLDIPGNALTIAAWIRPDTFGDDARIISKATGVFEEDHFWMLSTTASNGMKPRMRLKTNGGDTATLLGTVNLTAGAWTHLAATYDGLAMRLYVNGQPAGSLAKSGAIVQDPSVPAAIGDQPQGGRGFDGLMDDVHIYTRALDGSEIQVLMAGDL